MPYVLLVIGVALGLFGLYKFFVAAKPKQIAAFFMVALLLVLTVALFFMAVTGRLPAAIALVVAIWPVALAVWKTKYSKRAQKNGDTSSPHAGPLTRAEALEVLGLEDGVGAAEIEEAYKRLMMKVHPDQQGSDWMAAKLNEARDLLLK